MDDFGPRLVEGSEKVLRSTGQVPAHVGLHDETVSPQLLPEYSQARNHIHARIVPLFPLQTAHLRHEGLDAAHLHAVHHVSNLHATRLTFRVRWFSACCCLKPLAMQHDLGDKKLVTLMRVVSFSPPRNSQTILPNDPYHPVVIGSAHSESHSEGCGIVFHLLATAQYFYLFNRDNLSSSAPVYPWGGLDQGGCTAPRSNVPGGRNSICEW